PPLETSLSSSLDPFGSPFPHPLSQYVSKSHGRAAVFRYVSGESMSERGEDKPIDNMPTSLEDSHSTQPMWFTDTDTETKPPLKAGVPTVT
ncbi:sterile alpha motif domain-containing protein 10 isoform X1, partial [Lates japonicus]